jgi:hypothetical protein
VNQPNERDISDICEDSFGAAACGALGGALIGVLGGVAAAYAFRGEHWYQSPLVIIPVSTTLSAIAGAVENTRRVWAQNRFQEERELQELRNLGYLTNDEMPASMRELRD